MNGIGHIVAAINDVDMTAVRQRVLCVVVGIGHYGAKVLQWLIVVVVVIVVCEGSEALFRFGFWFNVKGRGLGGSGACALGLGSTLLPFEDTGPVGELFLIKFLLPLSFGVLTILAIMAAFVASGAVASLDVVIKLALELGSYFLAVNNGIQVRSF
jgi:hypothetical protein